MSVEYQVWGLDRFSNERYPCPCKNYTSERDAIAEAGKLNQEAPEKQPGGLHDWYYVVPIIKPVEKLDNLPGKE